MPKNNKQANLVFRMEVAHGHLSAIIGMLENNEPSEKVLHQICAVQAALEKVKASIQNQLLEEGISVLRTNPCDEENDHEVNKLLNLYTNFYTRK